MATLDAVTRLNAALEGRYRIERELGRGGMAVVYEAHDVRHGRAVALKVLKPELAAAVGSDRFLDEIQVTAGLQHPHILPLHDSGEADGLLYYVMPYVQGESLRHRLARERQLPVDEAVRLGGQIAEGLAYAHRQGVVHRDIKPANILLQDASPVIADFGIALALRATGRDRLTETGLSLGTPHYMSPEQATGDQQVGPATDIYALGCVLYEMLVGEPPFSGSTPRVVLGRIIRDGAPSAREERSSVPPNVDAAIAKALEKTPADRFSTAEELRRALKDPSFRHGEPRRGIRNQSFRSGMAVGAVLSAAVAAAVLLARPDRTPDARPLLHVEIPIPGAQAVVPALLYNVSPRIAMPPDGESFVYAGLVNGETSLDSRLYRRPFDRLVNQPIAGTEGGVNPFFSPDGRWLGFYRIGALMKVPIEGGTPLTIVEVSSSGMWGAWWSDHDTIYFSPSGQNTLWKVSADGGVPAPVLPELPRAPFYAPLPQGSGVLFSTVFSVRVPGAPNISIRTPSGDVRALIEAEAAHYSDGHLIFWRAPVGPGVGSLLAAPFDPDALELRGPARPILEQSVELARYGGGYRSSENGTLIYVHRPPGEPASSLVWVTRSGREEPLCTGVPGEGPRLSPDGSFLVIDGVSVVNLQDCTRQELTNGGRAPTWSPDGRRISFSASGLRVANANGAGADSTLVANGGPFSSVWSPDGSAIYFAESVVPSEGPRVVANRVVPLEIVLKRLELTSGETTELQPGGMTTLPTVSPDGAWIAVGEWEGTRREIHVARVTADGLSDKRRVAGDEAYAPVWSQAGDELFFRRGSAVVALPVTTEPTFRLLGAEDTLFVGPYGRTSPSVSQMFDYDHRTERFIMVRENEVPPSVRVVFNWRELLR